jgi:hypothetical protein
MMAFSPGDPCHNSERIMRKQRELATTSRHALFLREKASGNAALEETRG